MWRSTIAPSYLDANLTISLQRFYWQNTALLSSVHSIQGHYSHSHVQLRNITNKWNQKNASDVRICRCLYCEISHVEVNGANERQIAHVLVKIVRRRL